VRAIPAQRQDLAVYLRAIGTVVPLNTVTVNSRVEGQLLRVAFEEGQQVEKGQLLAEIDPIPYRIRLAQMEAQLRQNEAQLRTARSDLARLKPLQEKMLITQQEIEGQQALVAEREAAVAADQAQVDDARRQLGYTRIEAPISGRLGMRQVDVGNLIRPNALEGLVVITQTQPIAVIFTVPEIDLQKVIEPLRAGETLDVQAWDRTEQTVLARGALKTVDNQIDLATGTLRLKAEFPNRDERLFPNQFVNVRMRVRTLKDAIVVPTAAVQYGSRGPYLYLVNEESQATVRDVVLGPAEGEQQAIIEGLRGGEQVVLEGVDRLREGRTVTLVGEETTTAQKSSEALRAKSGGAPVRQRKNKGT
jgi:multidrug efflux system membrane fusion protein